MAVSKRVRLKDHEARYLGLKVVLSPDCQGRSHRYTLSEEECILLAEYRDRNKREFVETARKTNKNGELISKTEKLQGKVIEIPKDHEIVGVSTNVTTGQQWLKTAKTKEPFNPETIDFEKIISKYIQPINIEFSPVKSEDFIFDRLVYTDVHIGMTPNENGFSLYGGKWDEEEIKNTLSTMISWVLQNKKSNVLIIDELGDFVDGWNGQTVRQGHTLPQNMDNEKAFDVGVNFKMSLIDNLAAHYNKIICHNICNDNHAGSFGYVVNSAFKQMAEHRYKHVTVVNIRHFIYHYFYKDYCFILSHGKDGKNLKFGFKPILDSKQVEKIDNYLKHHNIQSKYIEFSKGDSHQKVFDESTSETFNYYSYGAASPSSEWVQTNFKKGKRFFEFFNFDSVGNKKHNPYFFEWIINREEVFNNYF